MAKDRGHPRYPKTMGLVRRGDTVTACGLCGKQALMTKAHVPPRTAGNAGLVSQVQMHTRDDGLFRTKARHGGVYVYGLCESCNNLASRYDSAYGELAWALQPLWPREPRLALPDRVSLPPTTIRPGATARSLLIGVCAVNPNIRVTHPHLAAGLLEGRSATLPEDMRLRIALNRSQRARVSGGIAGMVLAGPYATPRINDTAPGIFYDAAVYFPPLAWMLTRTGESILDRFGYGDASDWLAFDPTTEVVLADLIADLPYVSYPQHDPQLGPWWSEMFSDVITEIVETDTLPPGVLRNDADG